MQNKKKISIEFNAFCKNEVQVDTVTLYIKNGVFQYTYTIPENARVFFISLADGNAKDANGGKGYIYKLYGKDGRPVQYANSDASMLLRGSYTPDYGISKNLPLARKWLDEEFKLYFYSEPELRKTYYYVLKEMKDPGANKWLQQKLEARADADNRSEDDVEFLVWGYQTLGDKEQYDIWLKEFKQVFGNSSAFFQQTAFSMMQQRDSTGFVQKFDSVYTYQRNHFGMEKDKMLVSMVNRALPQQMIYFNRADLIKKLLEINTSAAKPDVLKSAAEYLSDKKKDPALAQEYMHTAVVLKERILDSITASKSGMAKERQEKVNANTLADYYDSYAYILLQNGYAKEAFENMSKTYTYSKGSSDFWNKRYANTIYAAFTGDSAIAYLEPLVYQHDASFAVKKMLMQAYETNSEKHAGSIQSLKKMIAADKVTLKKELSKYALNKPFPASVIFTTMQNEKITATNLKGKITVLDFWATWCGPCIASFPAMQMATDKYRANDNIQFFFVNTFENGNQQKLLEDFIHENSYRFQYVTDQPDASGKWQAEKLFGITSIPTKFIVDKNGLIRYKMTGFNGDEDKTLEELEMLIEMSE